jgi:hypothetical protein
MAIIIVVVVWMNLINKQENEEGHGERERRRVKETQ